MAGKATAAKKGDKGLVSQIAEYIANEHSAWERKEQLRQHDQSEGVNEINNLFAFLRRELDGKQIGYQSFTIDGRVIRFGSLFVMFHNPVRRGIDPQQSYPIEFVRQAEPYQNGESVGKWYLRRAISDSGDLGWEISTAESSSPMANDEIGLCIVQELVRLARQPGRS